jgi:7-keto-8-aminopelargonate synthetase-like enzyme
MGGASGGYTAGPKELIDLLRQRGRPYLFSNSLPPPVVATGIKVSIAVNPFNVSQSIIFTIKHCNVRICL